MTGARGGVGRAPGTRLAAAFAGVEGVAGAQAASGGSLIARPVARTRDATGGAGALLFAVGAVPEMRSPEKGH